MGSFELGPSYVEPGKPIPQGGAIASVREDAKHARWTQREQYYAPNRHLMLVHRIAPSTKPGQLYDVLLYLVPHPSAHTTLVGVSHVEYYFGKNWDNSIFTSTDRANGFAISTSAYGSFMCTAEIHFSDGVEVTVARYVDFEMGDLRPPRQ